MRIPSGIVYPCGCFIYTTAAFDLLVVVTGDVQYNVVVHNMKCN